MFVNAIDERLVRRYPALLEPVNHVRLAAHRPDLDHLLEPKLARRHARVDDVSQTLIALLVTLDDRGRVYAGRSPKRVASKDGIVARHRPVAGPCGGFTVLAETREIVVDPTEQLEIHKQLIERRVADAFAHAERRAVNLIGATLDCRERIDHSKPSILVPVPVETNVAALFLDDSLHELHHRARAVRGRMPDCIAHANCFRT